MSTVEPTAAGVLAELDRHGTVVWLAGPTGDEDLARDLGLRIARDPGRAELELFYGSWDPPGARLLDAVTVMDRLMAREAATPGNDRRRTTASPRTCLEEAYEAFDAIEADDLDALREELGDVLLQVVLHARLAEETAGFSVDDVAGDLVEKLIRRNPHVFADATVGGIDEIVDNWEADQEGGESPIIHDGRYRAVPAGAGARRQSAAAGRAGRPRRATAGR